MIENTNTKKTKILFIAGSGRSGSTLLDNLLGQIDGFFSVGEIHRLWDSGPAENRVCGCGEKLVNCPAWSNILNAIGSTVAEEMMFLQKNSYRTRHLLRMLMPGGETWLNNQLVEQKESVKKIYQQIQSSTGSDIIVDSSKFPSYAFVLDSIAEFDVYLLHLIRDPRAVAYSWQKDKFDPGTGKSLGKMRPHKSAALWFIWNIASEYLWRQSRRPGKYMRLFYEDFAREPQANVEKIINFLNVDEATLPFINPHEAIVKPTHSVCGNPVRFSQGATKIKLDTRWKTQMNIKDKQLVSSITWPLLFRYNYWGRR